MKIADVLKQLDADNAGKPRVVMGPLRALAKKLKTDHPLALALWDSGRTDARMLAPMLMEPKQLTAKQAADLLAPLTDYLLVDELTYKAVAEAPCADELSQKWIASKKELTARAGWNLLVARILQKRVTSAECDGILRTIEGQRKTAPTKAGESMMRCLVEIGVKFPEHRRRALEIGAAWGVLDDRPVPRGCTPFHAVAWIEAILKRKK